ncbi:MAG: HAMP domain-containing sensor histidine kinase [Rickettsiales bacterium]|nr:HAMP domain-containing sensor histidine kinase [Rickettsiales bacterium]
MTNRDITSCAQYQALEQDFANFVYSVSHDFNAPLRHVREFHKLLLQKREADASSDESLYIDMINQSLDHMQAMLDCLLEISHLSNNSQETVQTLDSKAVIKEAMHSFQDTLAEHKIQITYGENLPTICGQKDVLVRLFSEIIGNAIMFRSPNTVLQLDIAGNEQSGTSQLTFTDNGIGIAESFRTDAFTVFRKLHPEEHHEGMGCGLALCQATIRHLGGKIWFETAPDKGTRFHVTLPTC